MIRKLALAAALLGSAAPAFAQTGIGSPTSPNAPAAVQPAPAPVVYEGSEFNTNSYLKFILQTDGTVVMHDGGQRPVHGDYRWEGDRITITFGNCVYEGTRSGNSLSGMARFTSGQNAGQSWPFRLEGIRK
jgi:hypothetical protein